MDDITNTRMSDRRGRFPGGAKGVGGKKKYGVVGPVREGGEAVRKKNRSPQDHAPKEIWEEKPP